MRLTSLAEIISRVDQKDLQHVYASHAKNGPYIRCYEKRDKNAPCLICGGIGWYLLENRKPQRCRNYEVALDVKRADMLREQSGIEHYGEKTFDTFRIGANTAYTAEEKNSLALARRAGINFAKNPRGWLVYRGAYGCGKTHLALSIAERCISLLGLHVMFMTAADLLDRLRNTFSNKDEQTLEEVLNKLENAKVLVIDDYGAESDTEWAREKLFQLLNFRHSRSLPTVITTNLSIDEMPPRIRSRVMESSVVKYVSIEAPDYRAVTTKVGDGKFTVPKQYSNMSFETFAASTENQERAKEVAQRWTKNETGRTPLLCIRGTYNMGKTHLMIAMSRFLASKKGDILLINAYDLNDSLHEALKNNSVAELVNKYTNTTYLLIDNLSMEAKSNWSRSRLFEILITRIEKKSPTVITTTKSLRQFDKRLASRLADKRLYYEYEM